MRTNNEPFKLRDGWYVYYGNSSENLSGPWNTRAAAVAASEDDFEKASRLHLAARKVIS